MLCPCQTSDACLYLIPLSSDFERILCQLDIESGLSCCPLCGPPITASIDQACSKGTEEASNVAVTLGMQARSRVSSYGVKHDDADTRTESFLSVGKYSRFATLASRMKRSLIQPFPALSTTFNFPSSFSAGQSFELRAIMGTDESSQINRLEQHQKCNNFHCVRFSLEWSWTSLSTSDVVDVAIEMPLLRCAPLVWIPMRFLAGNLSFLASWSLLFVLCLRSIVRNVVSV